MARVYVSVGSNVDRERNIRTCLETLDRCYGPLTVSSVYETEAVGFDGEDFYNLAIGFDTDEGIHAVVRTLRALEDAHGRVRFGSRFAPRTLDLDLLLYDDLVLKEGGLEIPRPDIIRYAFVLGPLAEIAGSRRHPDLGETFAELWARLGPGGGRLRRLELDPLALFSHGA